MATKNQRRTIQMSVADAISAGWSLLEELGQEVRDVYDNMPESLQGGSRGEALDTAASTLEGLSEPEVPNVLFGNLDVAFTWQDKKRPSRAYRRDEGVAYLDGARAAIESWLEEQPEDAESRDDGEQLMTDLEELISEAEGVEFPGMYG